MPDRVVRRMLAFVEFADGGDPDTSWAIRFARQVGAELILFSVIDRPAMVALIGTHRAATAERGSTLNASLVADAKRILQRIVDQAAAGGVVARGHAIVSEEVPEQILKEAIVQHVDLILIRPTGRQGFLQRLMRSTVEEILAAAPCGVLVVQPK
ncbi:MAG: universal stress protein [Planctomycetes bacterium]|nr:universal stress protein [Planctomycetota bacterium]